MAVEEVLVEVPRDLKVRLGGLQVLVEFGCGVSNDVNLREEGEPNVVGCLDIVADDWLFVGFLSPELV